MDVVANAEDVAFHLRVPAMLLVAEVHASFEKLTHGEFWQCHDGLLLYRLMPPRSLAAEPATGWIFRKGKARFVCEITFDPCRTRGCYMPRRCEKQPRSAGEPGACGIHDNFKQPAAPMWY